MNRDEIAALAGVKVAGQDKAEKTASVLVGMLPELMAADKTAAVELLVNVMRDESSIDGAAAWSRVDPAAWVAWCNEARAVRGCSQPVADIRRLVKARAQPKTAPRLVHAGDDAGYDGPDCLPESWAAPRGWSVRPDGVWKIGEDQSEQVTTRPVWVTGYLADVDGYGHSIELTWEQVDRSHKSMVVDARVTADARALAGLVSDGLPGNAKNCGALSVYIDAALTANRHALPLGRVASRFGWMGGGFLLGSEWIGDGLPVALSPDVGLAQVASGYRVKGSWGGWLDEVVNPGRLSPSMWLAVYNSVASILIELLDLGDNWILDRSGETSQGKSTIGRVAASVWGDPRTVMRSWKVSPAGVEAHAAILQNLPLILDDSKKARRGEDVASVVYMHSGGQGAVRGKPGVGGRGVGLRAVESWRSSMDSSGEVALTAHTQDAGARARVLVLRGSPLDSAKTATAITIGTEVHHGHLGRRVVASLMADGADARWREVAAGVAGHWRTALMPYGAVAGRLGAIVAAMDLARRICEDAGLPSPPDGVDPISTAADAAMEGGADADRPSEALRAVYELAVTRRTAFWGRHEVDQRDSVPKQPHGGWLGAWHKSDDWAHLDITPKALADLLNARGYDVGVIDRWSERGWLVASKGCNRRSKVRIDGSPVGVYRISREALDSVGL